MTTDEIRRAIKAEPFRPFVLRLASGKQVAVRHPEFVAFSQGGRTLAVFSTDENAFEIIDLLLVEAVMFGPAAVRRRRSA